MVAWIAVAVVVAAVAGEGPVAEVAYLAVVGGAGVLAFYGSRRSPYPTMALLLAIGISISGFGDLIWQVLSWVQGSDPKVSVADVFWLGSYVAAGAALLRSPQGRGLDRDGVVDVAVIFLVAMLTLWELAFDEVLTDPTLPLWTRFTWALYPTFDAALLALVVRAAITRRMQGRVALLLGAGVGCWLVSDFTVIALADAGERDSTWVGTGWMLACLLMTAATWVRRDASPTPRKESSVEVDRAKRSGIAIALVPVLFPGALAVVLDMRGHAFNPVLLYATSVLLVFLAYTRGARILQDEAAARAAVRSQQRFAQAVASNSSDAMVLLDTDGIATMEAPQLAALLGHPGARAMGVNVFDLISPEDQAESWAVFERCMTAPGQMFETELRTRHGEGHEMWLSARIVNLLDDPDVGGVVVNIHDISDRRRAEEELSHQAFHDGLTDLPNRALFSDRVDHALRRNVRIGLDPVVIFLDLDGFKNVNDSLGHSAGDLLLRVAADRLVQSVRSGDTVARLGGDEFAVLLEQSPDPLEEAAGVAERILQAFVEPVTLDGQTVTVSASLGIAVGDGDATAASLLRDADVAMYRAKTAGKARWVVYDPEMRSAAVERLQLESDLVTAIDGNQFALVYQPVIQLESDRVVGFEALVRWNHPTLGVVAPDRFIPIAEENGLIVALGRWVLREATSTLARWHRDHPDHAGLSMAVNVSGRQLASTDLVADVEAVLAASGIEPGSLTLEITETALIQDTTVAAARLAELSALGVRLAIDDFGTGYSSLSYLRQFPIDILKIDRSFINTITDRSQVPAIVRGLLDLGRTLELETVAEGVELVIQRDQLRSECCDLAQGYLFSRPLHEPDAELLLHHLGPAAAAPATT